MAMDVTSVVSPADQFRGLDAADGAMSEDRTVLATALVQLFAERETHPTPREMAERSGLPLPTVFHLLDDLEGLAVAVFRTQIERVWSQLESLPGREEPLTERVDALVAQRARLFEQIAPTRRVAGQVLTDSPALRRGRARSEAFLRRQVTETFELELAMVEDSDGIAAIDFVTSWEAWEGLRRNDQHSIGSASRIMRVTLLALLTPS